MSTADRVIVPVPPFARRTVGFLKANDYVFVGNRSRLSALLDGGSLDVEDDSGSQTIIDLLTDWRDNWFTHTTLQALIAAWPGRYTGTWIEETQWSE
jgi:hypothetical protein